MSSLPINPTNEIIAPTISQPANGLQVVPETNENQTTPNIVSPWEILPPPTLVKSKNPRGRKPTKARLLTNSSFRDELIEVQQRKNVAESKKAAAALKKAEKMLNNSNGKSSKKNCCKDSWTQEA